MAASALLLSSAYKDIDPVPTYFSEIDPVSPYFVSLKILPMERSSASQSLKKKSSIRFWTTAVSVLKYLHI